MTLLIPRWPLIKMTPEIEQQILVAFEVLGPERVRMAVENAYPFVQYNNRPRTTHCFIGCATTQAERKMRFPQYNDVKQRFGSVELRSLETIYEFGDHQLLRELALQWLAGIERPPKERKFAHIGVAVMLLLLVLL